MGALEITIWVIVGGWGLNILTTGVSLLNDLYWKNNEIDKGFIACMAFSWLPYFVFFAGIKHFFMWVFKKSGP